MIGKTITWRIKIKKLTNWIALGIGLKGGLKHKDFEFETSNNNYCYLVASDGTTYAARDSGKNNKS